MSSLIGANDQGKPGLVTYMPEGQGERPFPAKAADVIPQGVFCSPDIANVTPAEKVYKICKLDGSDKGPFILTTKAKAAGEPSVVGIGSGFEGTILADGDIYSNAYIKPSTATAGQAQETADRTSNTAAICKRLYKFANSGDGNHASFKAVDGDLIVIRIL